MGEHEDREHFIRLRKCDLVNLLCADNLLPADQQEPFRQFCKLVTSLFHFEYLERLEQLKDAYAPFDPDADTEKLPTHGATAQPERVDKLYAEFVSLMERANFVRLSKEAIEEAMNGGASAWG